MIACMEWKTVIGAAAALGALITGLTNLVRWWRERSNSNKILDEMNKVGQLERFIRATSRLQRDSSSPSPLPALAEKAKAELDVTLSNLASTFDRRTAMRTQDSEMSFLRHWLLLYKPLGIRAVFAHFLILFLRDGAAACTIFFGVRRRQHF
jgi:hypothetical protein